MTTPARKIILPELILTEVSSKPVAGAVSVSLPRPQQPPISYYAVPRFDQLARTRRNNKSTWAPGTYRLFPVVLSGDDSPWAEANLWLLDMLEAKVMPNMLTFASIAEDLAAYKRFVEDENIEWLKFVAYKLRRPTYRYNAALRLSIQAGEVSASVAKRRMATVIRFYRWLMSEGLCNLANAPWSESDRYTQWQDREGFSRSLTMTTTDISIKTSTAQDPWDDRILDGGRLRPLPQQEQKILLEILGDLGNTEMLLIHLLALFSGARIQSVLTVRVRHVERNPKGFAGGDIRLKAGPGTGIDTKNRKTGVLRIPEWLYTQLYTYAKSDRARNRRLKAGEDVGLDSLLFLSRNGTPFYETQEHHHQPSSNNNQRRHAKTAQAVRQFNKEKLLPELQRRLNNPQYRFSFHDLRATFGMNMVDYMAPLISSKQLTYMQALEQLRQLMWHSSASVTEGYLRYRDNRVRMEAADDGWHSHLANLANGCASTSRVQP